MPLTRCWNFNDNGSRKTWPNGAEKQCRPNCAFTHPSDSDWDRSRTPPVRGGGPQGGRRRGQSSFGAPAPGVSSGSEWGSSSVAWDDYMTGFSSNPPAKSHARGAPSRQSDKAPPLNSGWGDTGAGGSGWGSGVDNNVGAPDGWSSVPATSGEPSSSSQWDVQPIGSGSSGNGWGSSRTDLGPGWGEVSISDQGSKAPSALNAAGSVGPDTPLGGTWTNDNSNAATATTPLSRAMPSVSTPSESDATHSERHGGDTPTQATADHLLLDRKASPSAPFFPESSAKKSITVRRPRGVHDDNLVSNSSGTDNKMSCLVLNTATTLKMRELDTEHSHLSALRKSPQVATTRAAKDLLRNKLNMFKDAQVVVEAEHDICSRNLMQTDSRCFSITQHALATLGKNNEQLEQLEHWVSGAARHLNNFQAEGSSILPVNQSNGVTCVSKLSQLEGRQESLAETYSQCQDLQFYLPLLEHQIQVRKDLIAATIIKGQEEAYNYLILTSLSTLQRRGELWNQTLQTQARVFAQALLQSEQLKKDQRSRSIIKAKEKDTLQQADIIQRRSQLQVLQEEMAQIQHALNFMKEEQLLMNLLDEYAPLFQKYIQGYIQTNTISNIKTVLSNTMVQFAATESETVQMVWKTLQPFSQVSIWLQDLDTYKTEEEMEIREIEESLIT